MVTRWAARIALVEVLLMLGAVGVRSQDYRMSAAESRITNLESMNAEKRLTRLETQLDTIEWLLKTLLGAVFIQLVGTGFTLFQRLAGALNGSRRGDLLGQRHRRRDADAHDDVDSD